MVPEIRKKDLFLAPGFPDTKPFKVKKVGGEEVIVELNWKWFKFYLTNANYHYSGCTADKNVFQMQSSNDLHFIMDLYEEDRL